MEKYKIILSPEAYSDLKELNDYILYELQEPEIAHKKFKLIVDELFLLDFMPNRNTQVNTTKYKNKNMRKMIVENYVIIYEVFDDDKTVVIRAIVLGNSDWQNNL